MDEADVRREEKVMDPTACWKLYLDALVEEEYEDAQEALTNLRKWLDRGGAPMDGFTYNQAYTIVGRLAHLR